VAKADRRSRGATPAINSLLQAGVTHTVHPYEIDHDLASSTSYGEAVAVAVGVDPHRLFKTLITTVDGVLTVGVVPVVVSLDLKALAAAVGGKRAAMAEPAIAERSSGYVTGGISPFGQRTQLHTVLDSSALAWPTIYVSAGRRGLQVELSAADLVDVTKAVTAEIATP
jgi:Cys-tRNA(Pro)/Cys-tRNA(Cys) deacylase